MSNILGVGDSSLPVINQRYRPLVFTALTATSLAVVGAFFIPFEAIKIVSATVLTAAAYGIANDMIACRDCIEYFTVGHFYDRRELESRPLNTLNPNLNALAWGLIATWHVAYIAGVFLAVVARIPFPKLSNKISSAQLAPYLAISATITLIVSHVISRKAQKAMEENPYLKYSRVPIELQSGWEACNTRNLTGYLAIALGGIVLSVAIIAARVGLINLKPLRIPFPYLQQPNQFCL